METKPNTEQFAALPQVTAEVVGLYLGDTMSMMLGTQGETERDELWSEAAQSFPAFGDKLAEIRTAIKAINETRKAYPPSITAQSRMPFRTLEDKLAKEFLGDILFSRMTKSPGYIDYDINLAEESQAMATEMGFAGWQSSEAAKVTLEKSVEAALTGVLRVSHIASK